MKASYIHALEMKAKWLRFAKEHRNERWTAGDGENWSYSRTLLTYGRCLELANAYYMNRNFCALVDHARREIPDDIKFEEPWVLSPSGFIWLETPFQVPNPPGEILPPEVTNNQMEISAVGWIRVTSAKGTGYHFMFFLDRGNYLPGEIGFTCWSHVTLLDGHKMIDRIREFESTSFIEARSPMRLGRQEFPNGIYEAGPEMESLHEIRWLYTALHLMSQRLAHLSEHRASGMARMMARQKRLIIAPTLKVISLRRMEAERPTGEHQHKDWNWQWIVQGHWRLQPYPKALGDYKWIFIESYIKGPENKPLKVPQQIIYRAER